MENLTEHLHVEHFSFAAGGFGGLYRAVLLVDSADPVTVAVKFPWPVVCDNAGVPSFVSQPLTHNISKLAERWDREVKAGHRVTHPNILPFLGTCNNPNARYKELPGIVLPYCANGNACKYLAGRPRADCLHVLCGAAAALFALHSEVEPVIHGDIKAVNILVGDDGRALLADFGLSRICGMKGFTTESVMGTYRWMAVELLKAIWEDKPIRTTTASDVWAFGMTILEILTTKLPFAEVGQSVAVFVQVLTKDARPERPAELSDVIWKVLERCWEEDPSTRPSARQIGLILDLTYGVALNDDDVGTVSGILNGTWDAIVPYRENSYVSDYSLPYRCKWLHCPRSFSTMEECIAHECAEFAQRRIGSS